MNSKKSMIGGIVVVLIAVAIIIFAVTGGKDNDTTTTNETPDTSSTTPTESTEDSTATPADTAEDDAAVTSVAITDFAYSPKNITVKVGTTVTWTNNDSVDHTVTASTESADAPDSELFGKGETYSFTFKKAGTYEYFCKPHTYMKGTVTVTE